MIGAARKAITIVQRRASVVRVQREVRRRERRHVEVGVAQHAARLVVRGQLNETAFRRDTLRQGDRVQVDRVRAAVPAQRKAVFSESSEVRGTSRKAQEICHADCWKIQKGNFSKSEIYAWATSCKGRLT